MEKKTLSYVTYIAAASFLILFFNSGARYAFGVALKPMISEFGTGRAGISSVFLVNMIVFAFFLIVAGKIFDRFGARPVLLVSTILLSLGLYLTSRVHSFLGLLFSYGIIAALGISGTSVPIISAIVSKWVSKSEGLIVSLSLSGNSIGQFVLVPLFGFLSQKYGWRNAYSFFAAIILVVNILLSILVIKEPNEKNRTFTESEKDLLGSYDMELSQSLKTPSMWFFMIMMFICGGGDYFVVTHLVAMATDFGISQKEATAMLGLYGLMSLLGILIAGPVADKSGCRLPIGITFILRVFLFGMIFLSKSRPSFYLFSFLFGLTHLVTAPLTPYLAGKMYGKSHLGAITGLINTVHFLGGGLMGYLGGLIFDTTGSYQLSFVVLGMMSGVAFLATSLIREKRHHV
ncbi:MAG: MFS transporter [Deltaproteobacteria bacterium]|nr:MFS transporter [Deltaproteobacteria bacterium]